MLKHGTNKGWEAGCRERCCINARQRFRYGMNQTGRSTMVPIEKVTKLLDYLWKQHPTMTYDEVADHIGVSRRLVQYWMSGEIKRIHQKQYDKIVEALSTKRASANRISSLGASRRIKAMNYRGFSQNWIAERTGLAPSMVRDIARYFRKTVSLSTHEKIRDLLTETLTMDPDAFPEAARVRARSRAQGHVPFGAWGDIDDPHCVPDVSFDDDLQDAVDRLKRLTARGFTMKELIDHSEMSRQNFSNIIYGYVKKVRVSSVETLVRTADHFEALPDPPETPLSKKSKTIAKRNGWV